MADRAELIRKELEPVVESLGLDLFDVVLTGSGRGTTLRVLVDRDGGVDLDAIESATLAVSPVLDADPGLVKGPYTLEVSSPGLERPLRRPEHFAGAVGDTVSVKFRDPEGRGERIRGVVTAATADAVTVEVDGAERVVPLASIEQARTVFEWGAPEKPGKGSKPGRAKKEAATR